MHKLHTKMMDYKTIDRVVEKFGLVLHFDGTFTSKSGKYNGYKTGKGWDLTFNIRRNYGKG